MGGRVGGGGGGVAMRSRHTAVVVCGWLQSATKGGMVVLPVALPGASYLLARLRQRRVGEGGGGQGGGMGVRALCSIY